MKIKYDYLAFPFSNCLLVNGSHNITLNIRCIKSIGHINGDHKIDRVARNASILDFLNSSLYIWSGVFIHKIVIDRFMTYQIIIIIYFSVK